MCDGRAIAAIARSGCCRPTRRETRQMRLEWRSNHCLPHACARLPRPARALLLEPSQLTGTWTLRQGDEGEARDAEPDIDDFSAAELLAYGMRGAEDDCAQAPPEEAV